MLCDPVRSTRMFTSEQLCELYVTFLGVFERIHVGIKILLRSNIFNTTLEYNFKINVCDEQHTGEDGFTHLVTGSIANTPVGTCSPEDTSIVRSISCLTTESIAGSETFDFVFMRVAECLPSVFENALPFECHEEVFDEETTTTTLPPRITTTATATTTEEVTTTRSIVVTPQITTTTETVTTTTTTEEELFLPIIPIRPVIPYDITPYTTETSTTTEEELFLPIIPIRPVIPYDITPEESTTTTESIVC